MQRSLYPLFQNQSSAFCCPLFSKSYLNPYFRINKITKQTYCLLSTILFLWISKRFISPELILNFLLNLYISPLLRKSFKVIVLRLLQIHLSVRKLNLFNFTHAPKKNSLPGFDHYPLGRQELSIPQEQQRERNM